MRLIAVAVPVPTLDALTYSVPDALPMPVVGARVLVPLGNRTLTGIVVDATGRPSSLRDQRRSRATGISEPEASGRNPNPEPRRTRNPEPAQPDILEVLDDTPFLPADVVRLASWVADYYASGAGEAMATAMPPRAWIESERYAQITEAGEARLLTERGVGAACSRR